MNDVGYFYGCAWGDFSNDGFIDLIVANYSYRGAGPGTNEFYRNGGDGTFTKVTQGDPVADADWHVFGVAGDYDNDGNLDLVVSSGAYATSARRTLLYHNNGDGTFSRVSGGSVTNQPGYFGPVAWGDYDGDGFLDLFVANVGVAANGGKNLLYHNNGDGTFSNLTAGPVVSDLGIAFCATWEDYDNDGFVDLLVINGGNNVNNFLYHNNRDGTFTRITGGIVATDIWPQGAYCAAWGDYDNDGFADLFVTDQAGLRNQLYHNNGDGTFTRVDSGPELAMTGGGDSQGCAWGDYDNDGYLDLFLAGQDRNNALFHNNGDGTFTQILSEPPVQRGGNGITYDCVSWVDYDNDGSLDLFVTTAEYVFPSQQKNLLYHNNGSSNAWLEVKLVGAASNRSGIGVKVRAHATIGGKTFWQLREIGNAGGHNTPPLVAHFGFGDATNIDHVRIEWPSGIVQTLTNVSPRQILTVTEHQQSGPIAAPQFTSVALSPAGQAELSVLGPAGLLYVLEGSTDLSAWTKLAVKSNATTTVSFTDSQAASYANRFYRVSIP